MEKLLFTLIAIPFVAFGQGQVFHFKEMTTTQVDSLDMERTAVIIPIGLMEEHGPYLPLFMDGYFNEKLSEQIGEEIARNKGFNVLIFPTIPLGIGSPEMMAGTDIYPGVVFFRPPTFRAVLMDIGDMLAVQGFKWVFIVGRHGSPVHNIVINQACDYVNANYETKMVGLSSLSYHTWEPAVELLTEVEKAENGLDIHAGMEETSRLLHIAPDLVHPDYVNATPYTAKTPNDFIPIMKSGDWKGYFGSPRLASVEAGKASLEKNVHNYSELAIKVMDGFDFKTLPRIGEPLEKLPENAKDAIHNIMELSREFSEKQNKWLNSQGIIDP